MRTAVNRPTNVALRDKTVSEKLQLYGVYSAFAKGKMPSNKQIDVAMNSALQSKALSKPSERLSPEGRKLVADLSEVIQNAKLLLLSKNEGQLIQDFIWHTTNTGRSLASDKAGATTEKISGPVTREGAQEDGQQALEGLKTLGKLFITNGQFRKLLKDASILARSMVGDAATSVSSRVNPTEDQLAQLDMPNEENTWAEPPSFGEGGNLKERLKSQYEKSSLSKKRQAGAVGQTIDGEPVMNDPMVDDVSVSASSTGSMRKRMQGKARSYLGEKIPEERRDATIHRLKLMIVEVQSHPEYQDAIMTLLNLLDRYSSHGKHYGSQGATQAGGVYKSESVQSAERSLKTLIERFANSTSLDDLIDSLKVIQQRASRDPDLRNWLRNLNAFIRRCLQEPGYILREDSTEEWNVLQDQGQVLAKQRYRPEFKRVVSEGQAFVKQFEADPLNKAFGDSVQRLCLDLGQDENGKPKFKPHLVKDLTAVIIPSFLENLSYVPLPRMEYSDHMVDLIVENLIIESDNLTPNVLEIQSDNHWRWGRKSIASNNKNRMLLAVAGIQMDLRDVSYYVRKKSGFPSLTDTGVMDIFLGGEGLSFTVELETANRFSDSILPDGAHYFKASNVKVNLSNLNIKLRKSSHKFLFALVRPILLRILKPVINKVVALQIKKSVHELDNVVHEINVEAKRAQDADKALPPDERAKQLTYRRYADLIKQRYLARKHRSAEAKEAAHRSGKEGKFRFVMTEKDTMFPNVKLPPGITAKATEYRTLAGQGTDWESPVFGIGKAPPSTKIPLVGKITRKSTWTGYSADHHKPVDSAIGAGSIAAGAAGGSRLGDSYGHHQDGRRTLAPGNTEYPEGQNSLPLDGRTYERAINPDTYQGGAGNDPYHNSMNPQSGLGGGSNMAPSSLDTYGNDKHTNNRFSNNSNMADTPMHLSAADKMAATTAASVGAGIGGGVGAAYAAGRNSPGPHGMTKSHNPSALGGQQQQYQQPGYSTYDAAKTGAPVSQSAYSNTQSRAAMPGTLPQTPELQDERFYPASGAGGNTGYTNSNNPLSSAAGTAANKLGHSVHNAAVGAGHNGGYNTASNPMGSAAHQGVDSGYNSSRLAAGGARNVV